jgi:hypothetical protein
LIKPATVIVAQAAAAEPTVAAAEDTAEDAGTNPEADDDA